MSSRSGGARLRRTWPQRLLITFNAFAVVAAVATAALIGYGKKTLQDVPRVDLREGSIIPAGDLPPGEPQNFLVVGNDSQEGLPDDAQERDGRDRIEGVRSDVIMVVRVNPEDGEARILSFPRDLWVDIPGRNKGRINSTVGYGEDGGPSLLIETLRANYGIDINHYVEINFAAFKSIVDQIGGVKIYISHPLRDGRANLFQPNTGCQLLDSGQALAYARARHLEWQDFTGEWKYDGTSDHGRISRQQQFIKRVLDQAISKGARNPATLNRLVTETVTHVRVDEYTTAQDLLNLGRAFRDFEPEALGTFSLPVVDVVRGGDKVLELVQSEAEPIFEQFRGTGSAGVAADILPSTITVRVLNGTGNPNEGTLTTDAFARAGFRVASPGDASETVSRTEVHHPAGKGAEALVVARHIDGDPVLVADDSMGEVTVITGPDLVDVLATPRPITEIDTATTTTTTTSTTSTTTEDASTTIVSAPTTSTTVMSSTPVKGYVPGEVPEGVNC